jgi:esterase/lipase superfamily enzyme
MEAQGRNFSRRAVLRGTGVAIAGGIGLTATSGTAAAISSRDDADAPDDFPRVSTRGHFDADANLINGEKETSYQQEGDFTGLGDETLTLFIHGWRASEEDALNGAYETQLALEQNGYGGDVASYTWDADEGDSVDLGWADAKDIAEKNGKKLANVVTDWNNQQGTDVRLIAHSLGARVTIFTMKSLEEDFGAADAVKSATLLGGAVEEDDVSLDAGWFDSEYGSNIEYAAEQFDNFYDDDDPVLEYVYETREFEDAVGEKGCDGPQPANYTDVDVTDEVEKHGDYYKRDIGIVDQVVAQW